MRTFSRHPAAAGRSRGVTAVADHRDGLADGHHGPRGDELLLEHTVLEGFEVHRRLVGLDLGEHVALVISSPTFLSQRVSSPSSIVSDRRGMITSGMYASYALEPCGVEYLTDHFDQVGRIRKRRQFEWFGVRQRHLGGGDAAHRRVQEVEGSLLMVAAISAPMP